MAHRAFAAFAARALALGVPAIAFAAFAAAFAFAWGFPASALPPLAPMRLRYCLMDSSTEPAIYYLAANKQSEPFREERCLPIGIWGRWIVPEKAETRLESGARILERRYWAHTETEKLRYFGYCGTEFSPKVPTCVFGGRISRKLAGDGFRTSQHANPLMVSFRCSTFAIRKSEINPSGTVLEKLIDPGKNHSRPFHIRLRGLEAVRGQQYEDRNYRSGQGWRWSGKVVG